MADDPKKTVASESLVASSDSDQEVADVEKKEGSVVNVLVQGVVLFLDRYNVQIIGYMQSVMAKL